MKLDEKIEWPQSGRYIVAVSGGIDSVTLLNLLAKNGHGLEIVVAYIDHGWRDASEEERLVKQLAEEYTLDFHMKKLNLTTTSEAEARTERYRALNAIKEDTESLAVVTGHTLDDRIETVILNLRRGGGRHALSPMLSADIIRPMLSIRHQEIEVYAKAKGLRWVEDPTNLDTHYQRNQIRHEVLPKIRSKYHEFDKEIAETIHQADILNFKIDKELARMVPSDSTDNKVTFDQGFLRRLPINVLQELLIKTVERLTGQTAIDRLAIEQVAIALKTGRIQKNRNLSAQLSVEVSRGTVSIAFKAP